MRQVFPFIIFALVIALDIYVYQAIRTALTDSTLKKIISIVYWAICASVIFAFVYSALIQDFRNWSSGARTIFAAVLISMFLTQVVIVLFLAGEDIFRFFKLIYLALFDKKTDGIPIGQKMSRSKFISQAALITALAPLALSLNGVLRNAYRYTIFKKNISIDNLPDALQGLRIVQLSDIHTGSFNNKKAVEEGVAKINALKADIILFTGDLVNNRSEEALEYVDVFSKIKAKYGVFSSTGNHDYGDYVQWPTAAAKTENFMQLIDIHKKMNWDLLMDEHRVLDIKGEKLALIGVQNISAKGFHTYGNLERAVKNLPDVAVRILLSHDPSHWDNEVNSNPAFSNIDLMLSGHTHGFQMGIESKWLKWSPSEFMYKQWAGLYSKGKQHLYVNRGFGFLGYPGRIGIMPEITELTLVKA